MLQQERKECNPRQWGPPKGCPTSRTSGPKFSTSDRGEKGKNIGRKKEKTDSGEKGPTRQEKTQLRQEGDQSMLKVEKSRGPNETMDKGKGHKRCVKKQKAITLRVKRKVQTKNTVNRRDFQTSCPSRPGATFRGGGGEIEWVITGGRKEV